jgi:DNA-binding MarR family transcriptional regulator
MLDEARLAAWINLGQAAQVVQSALDRRLEAAAGVSGSEFELLWRLQSTPDRKLQMTEIAELLLASKSGATRLVDRLVEAGLVSREIPADNRRVIHAQITRRGAQVLARAQRAFETAFEEVFSRHLTDDEVLSARRVVRKLLEANGAWVHERCEPALVESEPGGPRRGQR